MRTRFLIGFLLLVGLIALHFATVRRWPIPWFDEVYFASVAESFAADQSFVPQIASVAREGEEALSSGPLYFVLTAGSIKLFGLGPASVRIIGLLFGIMSLVIFGRILLYLRVDPGLTLLGVLLLASDPFYSNGWHSGRPDTPAIFFFLLSLFYLMSGIRREFAIPHLGRVALGSLFAGIAVLFTLRIGVLYLPAALIFLFLIGSREVSRKFAVIFWALVPFAALYIGWIFWGFSGFKEWWAYYQSISGGNETAVHGFLGGRGYIPRQEWPLLATGVFLFLGAIKRQGILYLHTLVLIAALGIAVFYLLVLDWGPYSVLILPFVYLLILRSLAVTGWTWRRSGAYAVSLLLLFNFAFLAAKSLQVISDKGRNVRHINQFCTTYLPEGSRVVADDHAYYGIRQAGSEMQLLLRYNTQEERERLQREVWDYDYLLVSPTTWAADSAMVERYFDHSKLVWVADLRMTPSSHSRWISDLTGLGAGERNLYASRLYRRVK